MESTIHHNDLSIEWMSHKRSKNAFVTNTKGNLAFGIFPTNTKGATVIVDSAKDANAALIIESQTGLVILRLSKDKAYYDIISAYDRKSHPGTVIATL